MSKIIIQHKVKDFKKWKKAFDFAQPIRKMYGEKEVYVFCHTGDPNDVSIMFEWNDPSKVIQYSQTQELRDAMKIAGVIDEPNVYILIEDLE